MPRRTPYLLIGSLLLALEWHYVNHTIDDAFIFFRYAENIARGRGWVFNVGDRVEAYSSFSWAAFLALAAWLGAAQSKVGLLVVAKIAGALLSLSTVWCAVGLARRLAPRTRNPLSGGVAALFLCLSAPFALWSVSGLETPLAALLAVLAVLVHLRERSPDVEASAPNWRSPVLFALAVLTRPEMFVLFLATLAFDVACDWRGQTLRARLKAHLLEVVAFASPCAAQLLWRRAYYGQWLPNTYYAKVAGDPLTWDRGTTYVSSAFVDLGLCWASLAALAGFVFARKWASQVAYIFWLTLCYALAIALEGGDWMPAFRFFMPILPFVGVLLDAGLSEAHDRCASPTGRWLVGGVGLAALSAALLSSFLALPKTHTPSGFRSWSPVPVEQLEVAGWINAHPPHAGLLALGEAGIVPYYTDLPVLDLFGLADRHIAHLPGVRHHKFDLDYVIARRPRYVLFAGKDAHGNPAPIFTYSQELLGDARFLRDYRVARDFRAFTLYERAN